MSRSIRTFAQLWTAIAITLAFGPARCTQANDPPAANQQPTSFWMKKKLEYSQNTLAAIATADFDKIIENAQAMRNLSKVEGFIRGQNPGYRTQLHIFDEANAEIIQQAKKENVEGAALAFTQLTISCVNCHKTLRTAK